MGKRGKKLTKEKLLESASEAFAEEGYRQTTVRMICKKASSNIASVNYYYRDKLQLYLAVVENEILLAGGNKIIPEDKSVGLEPVAKLKLFVQALLEALFSRDGSKRIMRIVLRELA